jgi:hypothetical protein
LPQVISRLLRAAFLTSFLHVAMHTAPAPLRLKWSELSATANGQHVIVDLKDGSHVNAIVTSVGPSALSLQVTSSSHSTYKKGMVSIPREGVADLRLIRMRARGRIIGTSIGAVVGLAGGGVVVVAASDVCIVFCSEPRKPNRFGQAAGFALMIGLPVAGYFIGKHADRQEFGITIVPE